MTKTAKRVKFLFDDPQKPFDMVRIAAFAKASLNIPELNFNTPPLPNAILNQLSLIDTQIAAIIEAKAELQKCKAVLSESRKQLSSLIKAAENNAINYIGDDEIKAVSLEATIEDYAGRRYRHIPDRPNIKTIIDGQKLGSVKIRLIRKLKHTSAYQVQYTLNAGKPDELVVLHPYTFTSVYHLTIDKLPSAQSISFEIRGSNSVGYGPWSSPFSKVIS